MTVDTGLNYGLAPGAGDRYAAARCAAIFNDVLAAADEAEDEAPPGDPGF